MAGSLTLTCTARRCGCFWLATALVFARVRILARVLGLAGLLMPAGALNCAKALNCAGLLISARALDTRASATTVVPVTMDNNPVIDFSLNVLARRTYWLRMYWLKYRSQRS